MHPHPPFTYQCTMCFNLHMVHTILCSDWKICYCLLSLYDCEVYLLGLENTRSSHLGRNKAWNWLQCLVFEIEKKIKSVKGVKQTEIPELTCNYSQRLKWKTV